MSIDSRIEKFTESAQQAGMDVDMLLVLIEDIQAAARKAVAEDIVIDLKDFLVDGPAAERPGMQAAIEVIESNY